MILYFTYSLKVNVNKRGLNMKYIIDGINEANYDYSIENIKGLMDIKDQVFIKSMSTIINTVNLYDNDLKRHCENVALLSKEIAKELGCKTYEVECAYVTGLLHDIGMKFVNKDILNKKAPLTSHEYEIVKRHCKYGYEIFSEDTDLGFIGKYIFHHHERYDGRGYPERLRGFNIPFISRIVSVADSYDAIRNDRPYRKKMSREDALIEIHRNIRKQFDPYVVDGLISYLDIKVESPNYQATEKSPI